MGSSEIIGLFQAVSGLINIISKISDGSSDSESPTTLEG